MNDFAFGYHSPRHESMFYESPLLPTEIKKFYPKVSDLVAFRKTASKHNVAIMPEISISTNAGGAYLSSCNVECPNFICEHGGYVPQDVNDDDYVAVVYSMVNELVRMASSQYIHLGYDEREISTPCFLEAKKSPDFTAFEGKIKKILELIGLTTQSIVRWENKEKVHYPGRFGDVTQCTTEDKCEPPSAMGIDGVVESPWFATVDVQKGNAFDIYSSTYDLASRSPIGIIAKSGSLSSQDIVNKHINLRLLAFTMGTLDIPKMNRFEFEKEFTGACIKFIAEYSQLKNVSLASKMYKANCEKFANSTDYAEKISTEKEMKLLAREICKERTTTTQVKVMKNASDILTFDSLHYQEISSKKIKMKLRT